MPLELTGVDLTTEEIRTDRLLLRPPRPDDEDAVLRACQDPDVLRWTASLPDPYTRDDARACRLVAVADLRAGRAAPGSPTSTACRAPRSSSAASRGRTGPTCGSPSTCTAGT